MKVFEQMNSRKYIFKLFKYKADNAELQQDVAGLLINFKDDRKFNASFFSEEVVSKFSYL
jgi:hypothetical protein